MGAAAASPHVVPNVEHSWMLQRALLQALISVLLPLLLLLLVV
jgi:hypothetical protein